MGHLRIGRYAQRGAGSLRKKTVRKAKGKGNRQKNEEEIAGGSVRVRRGGGPVRERGQKKVSST